jgi:hypothetical protein
MGSGDGEGDDETEQAVGEQAVGVARRDRHVNEDDEGSDEDEEEAGELTECGTKTTGEEEEDYEEDDTNPSKSGGDSRLGRGGHNVRVRLISSLPEDEIEDDDNCNEDGKGDCGQEGGGDRSNTEKQKEKKKKRGQSGTGGCGETSAKKQRVSGRSITKK